MNSIAESKNNVTNGKAIASLVLGILSIVTILLAFMGLVLGVIGLVLGIIGLQEVKRLEQAGRKVAVAGIICSSLGILLPILSTIIAFMAFMGVSA